MNFEKEAQIDSKKWYLFDHHLNLQHQLFGYYSRKKIQIVEDDPQ